MSTQRSVITVGNFDGVHRGHRALLAEARRIADQLDARVVVVTFIRHPLTVLRPEAAPAVLMDLDQRRQALLDAVGSDRSAADEVDALEPDPHTLLNLDPQQFVDLMICTHHPVAWIEGSNFRFGRGRAGDIAMLEAMGSESGFDVHVIEPVHVTLRDKSIVPVSSSLIRWLIAAGRLADAELCLGHPYTVRGPVVAGDKRGRQIGFPTANIDTADRQLPADGVYAGLARFRHDGDDHEYAAAISVGTNPTFDGQSRTFEAYLLDYEGDLYGKSLDVDLLRWLRDQSAFPDVDTLVAQMHRDVAETRRLHEQGMMSAASLAQSDP